MLPSYRTVRAPAENARASPWYVHRQNRRKGEAPGQPDSAYLMFVRPPARALSHRQHDPEAGAAAHHAIVGLGDAIERIGLVHRPYAGPRAEGERVLRVDRGPRIPALDGAATHQQR